MEAIILAGGKAERLGDAARGRPKALVHVAGRPLVAYQVARLARAGVERVIVACAPGREALFERRARRPRRGDRRRRGAGAARAAAAGIRFAARSGARAGDVFALNGDELLDVDFARPARAPPGDAAPRRRSRSRRPRSPFGVVDVGDDDVVTGFREAPLLPYWVNCGVYVLDDEAIERLPERGDHETTTFPELAAEGRLRAYRHEGCG